jgi:hypothetical protein
MFKKVNLSFLTMSLIYLVAIGCADKPVAINKDFILTITIHYFENLITKKARTS